MIISSGVHNDGEYSYQVEVIDIDNPNTQCEDLPSLQLALRDSVGALGFTENPLICGGSDKGNRTRNNCYSLLSGTWMESAGFSI